jgi:hypothetical protein
MSIVKEYTKGVDHMKALIQLAPEFESRGELHPDCFYPLLYAAVGPDDMDMDIVLACRKEKVQVRETPGEGVQEMELYVDNHFAFSVEESA